MPLEPTDLIIIERGGLLYQGSISQVLALSGGGGGIVWNSIVIPALTPFVEEMVYVHVNATVSPTSNIIIMFEQNDHNDQEDYADDQMKIHAVAETGQVRIHITGNGYMCGPYNIKYGVS